MPPPGRRKSFTFSLLPLLVLLILSVGANAASAALGVDFGTEYIKAAIAKPGSPIEIVLTKDSKRKEAAALAFKPSRAQLNDKDAFPERLYGGDALAVAARYPADVFPNLKALLGISTDDAANLKYSNRFPGLQIEAMQRENDGQSLGIKSQNLGRPEPFLIEELIAMELQNIKANAEAAAGKNNFVSDIVITYPAFYTAEEKKALELAVDLAGLRLLALISDGQAVGLNYATTRAFDPKKKDQGSEYHVVYDMGAGSTTATVLKIGPKVVRGPTKKNQTVQEVQVLGFGYDRFLGGDGLNDIIVEDMITKFVQTISAKKVGIETIQIKKDGKSMARLWKDAEKIRQVLSANQQASASFEGLYNEDVNFKYTLTRTEFESLAAPFSSQIAAPLLAALDMASIPLSQIDSVMLHGGLTRTPFVQSTLEKAAGSTSKIKTNINADEAAAFGAAFRAASLSTSFRVKDIRISDIAASSYIMKWTSDGKTREQKIFLETSQVGAEKQVPVKGTDDLTIEFLQVVSGVEEPQPILSVDVSNLTKSLNELKTSYGCDATNITTIFSVRLSPLDGLPEISSGSVSCEAQKAKEGSVIDNVKGMFGFGSKKGEQQPLQEEADDLQDPNTETPLPFDDPTSSGTIVSEATLTTSQTSSTASVAVKQQPSTVTIPLALKPTVMGTGATPRKALPMIKQRLTAFDSSDKNAVLRSEALNVLEAFTYRARDYLDDDMFSTYSTPALKKSLQEQLSKVSDWLYGEGTDAKLQEFKDKLKSLKSLVDPVLKRKEEAGRRDQAIETLRNSLSNAESMMDMMKGLIEQAAKDAASDASATATSASESVASAVSSAVAEDEDLDQDSYASSAQQDATEPESIPKPYVYTQEDLDSIRKIYTSVSSWLDDKIAAQSKLSAFEDPALLVADIEAKAKQVGGVVSDVVMKQIKLQQPPKQKKTKTTKKPKKTKSATVSQSASDTSSTVSATATKKDEL